MFAFSVDEHPSQPPTLARKNNTILRAITPIFKYLNERSQKPFTRPSLRSCKSLCDFTSKSTSSDAFRFRLIPLDGYGYDWDSRKCRL